MRGKERERQKGRSGKHQPNGAPTILTGLKEPYRENHETARDEVVWKSYRELTLLGGLLHKIPENDDQAKKGE